MLIHGPALELSLAFDDIVFLGHAAGIQPWPDTLHRIVSNRGYFTLGWELFGPRPELFHAAALALHVANGCLVHRLARRLGLSDRAAAHAAVLFVASPAAFTALHWISATQELVVAFFSLLAALAASTGGIGGTLLALGAGVAALLSKETAVLLLPALALVLPLARRDRWLLGLAGLGLAILLPLVVKLGGAPPTGHAYEYAFGTNLLWNGLTFSAWLVRLLDYYPDRLPRLQPGLALQGLVLPALLLAAALIRPAWRGAILRAVLVAVALLAPVLPLVRHSYFYYLYLPLVPLWLLAGAGLERLPGRRGGRALGIGVLVVFVALGAWRAEARRSERVGGLPADPMLRWGPVLDEAVASLAGGEGPAAGHVLILAASEPLHDALERALYRGVALRLFYPEIESVSIRRRLGDAPRWRAKDLYLATGRGRLEYLGPGVQGARALARRFRAGAPEP